MKKLNLIYNFKTSQHQDEDFVPASYKILFLFDDESFIESSLLAKVFNSFNEFNFEHHSFISLDDLKNFSLRIADELGAPEVRLISVQDFNVGVDGARDLKGLKEIFSRYGEVTLNEKKNQNKNFLRRFFN